LAVAAWALAALAATVVLEVVVATAETGSVVAMEEARDCRFRM